MNVFRFMRNEDPSVEWNATAERLSGEKRRPSKRRIMAGKPGVVVSLLIDASAHSFLLCISSSRLSFYIHSLNSFGNVVQRCFHSTRLIPPVENRKSSTTKESNKGSSLIPIDFMIVHWLIKISRERLTIGKKSQSSPTENTPSSLFL